MKKVLAAALLCAASSAFATWDLFPAQEAGKGEAKVGFEYGIPGEKSSVMGLNIGARYSIIEGLEAAIMLGGPGFVLSKTIADEDAKVSGLSKPVIGVRYWLPLGLGIAVDAALPVGSEKVVGTEPQFGLDAGLQFSTNFTPELSFGSEAILSVIDKESKDVSNGMSLNAAIEFDYSLGAATPWLGLDITKGLTKPDAGEVTCDATDPTCAATIAAGAEVPKPDPAPLGLGLSVGVVYDITESMYADASFWIGIAGDAYKDYKEKTINVDFGIKF